MTVRPFLQAITALVFRSHIAARMSILQSTAAISRMLDRPVPPSEPEPIDNAASLEALDQLMAGLG